MSGAPFYAYTHARFVEMVTPFADGLRSLPLAQLELEYMDLIKRAEADTGVAGAVSRLLLDVYVGERDRRTNPELAFDGELDAVLSRLERQTNEEDRRRAHEIGKRLFAVGGADAMARARARMIDLVPAKRQQLRSVVIEKRWAGIDK